MKKAIFLCLLSLSVCLSHPTAEAVPPIQTPPSQHVAESKASPPSDPAAVAPAHSAAAPIAPSAAPAPGTHAGGPQGPAIGTLPAATNSAAVADTKPAPAPATPAPPVNQTATDNKTSKEGNNSAPGPAAAADGHKPDVTDKAVTPHGDATVTLPPHGDVTVTPHAAPTAAPHKAEPTLQARGFDGPSFIGGIILTLGLLAIGFMGFKYYKNQTERNYHTL